MMNPRLDHLSIKTKKCGQPCSEFVDEMERLATNYLRRISSLDLRSLAFFRIVLGVVVLVDLIQRLENLPFCYTEEGCLPLHVLFDPAVRDGIDWSLFFLHKHVLWQAGLFVALLVAASSFCLGYRTRLSTILLWVLFTSLTARNPYVCYGVDTLIPVFLFWSCWLPLGTRWSLDALLSSKAMPTNAPERERHVSTSGIASFAFLFQIALLYWFTAITKAHPMWREDFTAIESVLRLDSFATPFGQALLQFPEFLKLLTRLTLWLEEFAPILLFLPWFRDRLRMIAVVAMCGFHLIGIGLTMRLGIFPFACAAAWLAVIPSSFWSWIERLRCSENQRVNRGPSDESVQRVVPRWKTLTRRTVLFSLLIYVTLWNVRYTLPDSSLKALITKLDFVGEITRLNQEWVLFGPRPRTTDYWLVAEATLEDGRKIDLMNGGQPVGFDKPEDLWSRFRNDRQRKLIVNMCINGKRRPALAGAFAEALKSSHPEPVKGLTLYAASHDHLKNEGVVLDKIFEE